MPSTQSDRYRYTELMTVSQSLKSTRYTIEWRPRERESSPPLGRLMKLTVRGFSTEKVPGWSYRSSHPRVGEDRLVHSVVMTYYASSDPLSWWWWCAAERYVWLELGENSMLVCESSIRCLFRRRAASIRHRSMRHSMAAAGVPRRANSVNIEMFLIPFWFLSSSFLLSQSYFPSHLPSREPL